MTRVSLALPAPGRRSNGSNPPRFGDGAERAGLNVPGCERPAISASRYSASGRTLRLEWIASVLAAPARVEVQPDGRVKVWGYIPAVGHYLRVVILPDGAVHNAFPDRDFGGP